VEETAELLRSLGHEVTERDPDYGLVALRWAVRYFRGIHDEAGRMAHPDRLEPRTRAMARIGRLFGEGLLARARAAEAADAARIGAIFDDVDVVLGPALATLPIPIGRYTSAGALRTFLGASRFVPFSPVWNHTGHPAMTLPAAMSAEGVPLSVQIVGPPRGEERLIALAAQVERARPWAHRIPPLALERAGRAQARPAQAA
jgi:amidase